MRQPVHLIFKEEEEEEEEEKKKKKLYISLSRDKCLPCLDSKMEPRAHYTRKQTNKQTNRC